MNLKGGVMCNYRRKKERKDNEVRENEVPEK
jgi:hypothetical protein